MEGVRKRNIFNPNDNAPFKLSRTKIELFFKCKRCLYLDRRLGIAPPGSFPFNINEAVDILFKKEFDKYREKGVSHPIILEYGLNYVPYKHKDLSVWRNPFVGIEHYHKQSNFIVFGGVDDVWVDDKNNLVIVDYKATSKDGEITIDKDWQMSYKRQIEIYQWLFKKNEFNVLDVGYFVYANALRNKKEFGNKLHFDTTLIPYKGNTDWVDDVLIEINNLLSNDEIPEQHKYCELCTYRNAAGQTFKNHLKR